MGSLTDYYSGRNIGADSSGKPAETAPTSSHSPTSSIDLSPAVQGLASQAAGYGLSRSPVSGVPGVGGAVGGGINAALGGASPTGVAQAGIQGGIQSLFQNVAPNLSPLGSILGAVGAEMLSENPQPAVAGTKAGISTLGALFGSPLGPIGSMAGSALAGYVGNKSFADGYLGDAFGARSRESQRDAVERDLGQSQSSTAGMAASDRLGMREREDGYGFGLSANYGATKQGVMSKSIDDPFGAQKKTNTLSSYYSQRVKDLTSKNVNDVMGGWGKGSGMGEKDDGSGSGIGNTGGGTPGHDPGGSFGM
jgi:hypothetical protein